MLAGVGLADITPARHHRLQGHAPCTLSTRVLFPLAARAVVFREGDAAVAIVSVDVISLAADDVGKIRTEITQKTGIPGDRVMIACSHTQFAPASIPALGLIPDEDWMQRVYAGVVKSVVDAAAKAEPVMLGLNCGAAHFNINRREAGPVKNMTPNPGGVVDHRARVLRVEKRDGSMLATLFHFSCHPTVKSGNAGLVSPDYPGVARMYIEKELGGAALFMPGCFGNVKASVTNEAGRFTAATDEQLVAVGEELGHAVCVASRNAKPQAATRLEARTAPVEIAFGASQTREELEKAANGGAHEMLIPWGKRVLDLFDRGALPSSIKSEVQLVRVGPVVMFAVGGEVAQEIGFAIEKALLPRAAADDVWAMGYSNDALGYLNTARHYKEGGYEPTAYPWYEMPLPFKDEEKTLVAAAVDICGK